MNDEEFKSYGEIPESIRDYIKTVADVKSINRLPLKDINGFIAGLQEWYQKENEVNVS